MSYVKSRLCKLCNAVIQRCPLCMYDVATLSGAPHEQYWIHVPLSRNNAEMDVPRFIHVCAMCAHNVANNIKARG